MAPGARAPVIPSRPRWATSAKATLRPRAAASPSISAVPEGASTLRLWCASKISTSQSRGPSSAADCSTRPMRTLIPSEKLAARTIATFRAAPAMAASCLGAPPVGPDHERRPAAGGRAFRQRRGRGDGGEVDDDGAVGEDGVCASQRAAVDRLARPLGQVAHRPQRRVGRSLDSGDHRPAHAAERAGDANPYRFGHLVLARSPAAQSLRGRTLSQC